MTGILEHILRLHGWLALLIVFSIPALESSAFVGFVFPGETALLLGGVLASFGRVSLWAVLVAGIGGAVIGDSVGYLVGRKYGERVLRARLLRRFLRPRHVQRAQTYLAERGGRAVFFGRFTAALRVLVPGFAGMARMPYRVFLPFNLAGGAVWGSIMVVLGYVAGASWKRVAHYATQVGIGLLVVVVLVLVTGHLVHTAGDTETWAGRQRARLSGSRAVTWVTRRFPGQVAWFAGRFQTGSPTGFPLTVAVLALAACAWSVGSLTYDVIAKANIVRFDPRVLAFFISHRTALVTSIAKALSWLGSSFTLWPVVVVAGAGLWWWRRNWLQAAMPALALAGSWGLSLLVKSLVGRGRPPAGDWLGVFTGPSYPSQHAAQALATWGMLALMVMADRSPRTRMLLLTAVALIALAVGLTRVYLAAHWMTDVLGGWALGGMWGCLLIIPYLFAQRAPQRHGRLTGSVPVPPGRPQERPAGAT